MLLKDIPVFQALHKRMDWLSARQTVLAENVANADTPGFRARDLKELSFRELMAGKKPVMSTARTHSQHLQGTASSATPYADDSQDAVNESTPSENAVVLEEQTLKVSDTRMEYDLATSLYRKNMNMIRTALGRPR